MPIRSSGRCRTLDGVEQLQRIIEIDFLDQEVDEGPRRQPAAVAHIDDVDLLYIAGIVGLQHWNKSFGVDVRSDVEQRQSRDALAGQSQAALNLAIARNNIAASRQRQLGSINDKGPLIAIACKVEGDAIMGLQIVGRLRHAPAG